MSKLELQRGHKIYLGVVALVFIGSAVGGWFVWKSCESLDAEHEGLETQIQAARAKINRIEDLERDVIILRENVEDYVRILPSDSEVNEFYRNIQEFVTVSGVRITELNPQPQRGRLKKGGVFDRAEYKLRFDANFSQFLQFINRIENHERFVSISEIRLGAGDKAWDSDEEPLHDVALTVVTYVYKGDEIGETVNITGYDAKKIQLLEQIAEARHDFSLERFQLLSDGVRRDPMVDPRIRVSGEVVAGADLEEQERFLEEVGGQIEECAALLDMMEGATNVMREMELRVEALSLLSELQTRVDMAMADGLVTAPQLKRRFEQGLLPQLTSLRMRAGQMGDQERPDEELIRMQGALTQMAQAFEVGDYEDCTGTYEMYASIAGASTNPELQAIQSEMEALYLAANTALDFMKLEIDVTGMVMYPRSDADDRESVAIVNDIVYREGEAISDDLFLMEIAEDHLVFEYRGVPLTFDY